MKARFTALALSGLLALPAQAETFAYISNAAGNTVSVIDTRPGYPCHPLYKSMGRRAGIRQARLQKRTYQGLDS